MREPAGVTRPVSAASEECKYQCFSQGLVEQLVSIYRTMFPHGAVPDEFYEHVVRKLDDQVAHDQDLSGLLFNGVETLNRQLVIEILPRSPHRHVTPAIKDTS